jgi:hypothetical protein
MSIENVRNYFRPLGREEDIMEFEVSSATVELAAQAIGCEGARITKTLAFKNPDNTYTAVGTIDECVEDFLRVYPRKRYDGIICSNDTVAICLINRMMEEGYRLPDDCRIIGMGDSCLAANHSLSVSSVMFDYVQMGEAAIELYHTVAKTSSPCHYTISLPCCFVARASTGSPSPTVCPAVIGSDTNTTDTPRSVNKYFDGKATKEIIELEAIFQKCDTIDRQAVFGLARGESIEEIAEKVHLTPRAVRYRISNFFDRNTPMTQNEFISALKSILK